MWMRRPYAQLAKCAGAQALRIAFPELTGAQPTADEMEGKVIEEDVIETTAERVMPPLGPYPESSFSDNLPKWSKLIISGKKTAADIINMVSTKAILSEDQQAAIRAVKAASLLDTVRRICADAVKIDDRSTAYLRLDDAEIILPDMSDEDRYQGRAEIDHAIATIKGRK
jgi:hypothetical protein